MKKVIIKCVAFATIGAMVVGLSGCDAINNIKNLQENASGNSIRWIMLGDAPKDLDKVIAKANEIIEPELGMPLTMEYIDSASFNQKTKAMMASGDDYDLIFTGYVNDYQTAVGMGGFYDITDIMENIKMKDGTTVKMSDAVEDYFLESARVNGRIYGIPNTQVISNPNCIQISKELAQECGVDIEGLQKAALKNTGEDTAPKYLDKISEEYAKVKAKRPDLYTTSAFVPTTHNYLESFVGGTAIYSDGHSSEVVIPSDLPSARLSADTIYKWNQAGYFRPDIVEKGNSVGESNEEKLMFAFSLTNWKPGGDVYYKNQFGIEPIYAFTQNPYVSRQRALATMIGVGKNTKHPEEAVKLIYMMNSNPELYNIICWGIEGEHYQINEDGTATEIGENYKQVAQNAWKYGNQFNGFVMEGQPLDVWEQTKKMNDDAIKSPALGFVPDTAGISTEIANIQTVSSEFNARVNWGSAPSEEYWDEYVQKLKNAGIEKIRDEMQKQYDAFLASKN